MNKFYDLILAKYKDYLAYNSAVEITDKNGKEKRKQLLKEAMEAEKVAEGSEQVMADIIIFERILKEDAQRLFYELYNLVEVYTQLEDTIELPEELVETCKNLSHLIPKTFFALNSKGEPEEKEKGALEKVRKAWIDAGVVKNLRKELENKITPPTL